MDDVSARKAADHGRRFRSKSVALETLFVLGRNYRPVDRFCLSNNVGPVNPASKSSNGSAAGVSSMKKKGAGDGSAAADGNGQSSRPKVSLASNMEPTYYIGGGNGNALIEETMNGLGWRRIKDKSDEAYRLRWCELKSSINYNTFKEGEQMANHIPNCNLLTNKLGLLDSLQEYSRVSATVQRKGTLKLDFIPETYRLDDPKDRQTFVDTYKENEIWICKPTGRNQGKGIFLVRSLSELNQAAADQKDQKEEPTTTGEQHQKEPTDAKPQKPLNRIIQRYIINPLLVDGRKFDIRCYMLIANTVPYIVLYHKGYLRLSMYEYDNNCENIIAHLTNQFIQKKDPKYVELKEETAWSMDRFNDYVNEKLRQEKGLEKDWVYNTLTTTMTQIMTHTFVAVKHKLQRKVGYFDLYGLDFMIDENMKVWMIEVNVNPCLATNCAALKEVVPGVVRETIHLAIECFEKSRKGRPLLPLQSLKEFQVIHCESPPPSSTSKPSGPSGAGTTRTQASNASAKTEHQQHSKSVSPIRRSRSISPVKEGNAKQTKKPDPTVPLVPLASASKGRPSEATKDASAVRARKTVRAQGEDAEHTVQEERKETETVQDKERGGKGKMTKRRNGETPEVVDNTKEKIPIRPSAGAGATKEGEKHPGSPVSAKPSSVKATANAAESKTVKAPNSTVALKLTNNATASTRKKQAKEISVIREEKPNRGS